MLLLKMRLHMESPRDEDFQRVEHINNLRLPLKQKKAAIRSYRIAAPLLDT